MLSKNFGVTITTNRLVERFLSTLLELVRCMKTDTIELILLATSQYNKSIHSVVKWRPADIVLAHRCRSGHGDQNP